MNTLMQVSNQWATRPADERFTSLPELLNKVDGQRQRSLSTVVSSRQIKVQPAAADERKGIEIIGPNGKPAIPTHWSFGQLASLSGAPASYLRKLPAPLVADCMNYGLRFNRDAEDVGVLLTKEDAEGPAIGSVGTGQVSRFELRAATGPGYGRVWNSEIVEALMHKFGDGRTGDFRVPGEFGKEVDITKANTTIYGSDRDIFVFLADEKHRIDMPNRRNGETGSLARGFFVWNSEVGSQSIGAAFFLFDYVCQNRIVWGVQDFKEMRLRHTKSAPDRWLEEISPVLVEYSNASSAPVMETIKAAQDKKFADDLDDFLAKRFTKSEATAVKAAHEREEGRPIETLWDVVTGVTAHAKTLPHQDSRVAMERVGGKILDLVAA
jgi:hypothetical protein